MTANSNARTLLLGGVFLVALSILGYYTLFLTDINWFKKTYELQVHFANLNGLREGDAVHVAGMRWGRIKSMEFDPDAPVDKRITVIAVLEKPLQLREGALIQIEDATLLGGRNLSIDPGPAAGQPLPKDQALFGKVAPNPLDALGALVTESQKGVSTIIENMAAVAEGLRGGKGTLGRLLNDEQMANDLAETFAGTAKSLAHIERISKDLAEGRGTAGMLLTNTEVYDNLASSTRKMDELLTNAIGITGDLRAGKGVLGTLLEDQALAQALVDSVLALRSMVQRIERGEGSLGLFLNDETLAQNLKTISQRLVDGEGSAGKFLTRDEVYDNLRETSENMAVVTGAIRSGEGSIGRLVMDDELYQQIKSTLSIVQRALEEYREAAPITTFTSVFFGVF